MSVTIRDIAKICNVSPGTVSRVFNNRKNVQDETRKRILDAMQKNNYNPKNKINRKLLQPALTYGIAIPSALSANPSGYFTRVLQTYSDLLKDRNYTLKMLPLDAVSADLLQDSTNPRTKFGIDSLVIISSNHPKLDKILKSLKKWRIPTVLIRRDTGVKGIPVIKDDDFTGTRLALNHLWKLHHRRIAFINPGTAYLQKRTESYRTFLTEKNAYYHDTIFTDKIDYENYLDRWAKTCMDEHGITAFLCGSDEMAFNLIKSLKAMGRRVPEDIAVVGYDDSPIARLSDPAITSIHIPIEKMLEVAIILLKGSEAWNPETSYEINIPNTLVVRESSLKSH